MEKREKRRNLKKTTKAMNAFETGDCLADTETTFLLHVGRNINERKKRNGWRAWVDSQFGHYKCFVGAISSLVIVVIVAVVILFGTEGVLSETRIVSSSDETHSHALASSALDKVGKWKSRYVVEKPVDMNDMKNFEPLIESQQCMIVPVHGATVGYKHVEYVYSPSTKQEEEEEEVYVADSSAKWHKENKGMIWKRNFEDKETKKHATATATATSAKMTTMEESLIKKETSEKWVELEQMSVKDVEKQLGWKLKQPLSLMETVTLTFATKQQNSDLESVMAEVTKVSDPKSRSYGRYWTYAQVHNHFKPSSVSIQTLVQYLTVFGILEEEIQWLTPNGDWLRVTMTVWQANALLNTKFAYWEQIKTGVEKKKFI
ncbi:hypothetical protein RFI_11192 [Reticulomyxa filosa]|uniref:Peptidase S53 activation domain-containing protein n=1 Tax=Reticulomyxa filosa TaxID=46433 RepID=X6NKR1_RETFI|nr:hypothetical protein RFI_11192 [Reticulomyxa filosa]|eukprot:ETO25947.1 hypothetical protein RFI_11192 [Reticulomyxa filosa]